MSTPLYACSTNPGKLREFSLAAAEFELTTYRIEPLPDLKQIAAPEEDGLTFEENARLKAAYYSRFTSELVFADDSGLEVAALSGEPGVHSARFAGLGATDQANNDLLVSRLAGRRDRRARFVCVIALARAQRILETFCGTVEGEILDAPRGGHGFGYDPLFLYPPLEKSFAELSAREKLHLSHRGHALQELFKYLRSEIIPR